MALDLFHAAVRDWFRGAFPAPTTAQRLGWPAIARGDSTLILAPTGSGKTLAAFLWRRAVRDAGRPGSAAVPAGLQARIGRSGTAIAGSVRGGHRMAEQSRNDSNEIDPTEPSSNETKERGRPGDRSKPNRRYEEAGRGGEDVDPDSADAEVDRDDSVND